MPCVDRTDRIAERGRERYTVTSINGDGEAEACDVFIGMHGRPDGETLADSEFPICRREQVCTDKFRRSVAAPSDAR